MEPQHYTIRGGVKGRERLRILSRVMQPTTLSLFQRAGIPPGMSCIDVGCGGGDVSFDLARIVGPEGRVVGIDIDETKVAMARNEAAEHELNHVEFLVSDVFQMDHKPEFNVAYARFLLTHLKDPGAALREIFTRLVTGGVVIIEDIDFTGHFCYPDNPAFRRYVQFYTDAVLHKGGHPNIGPRLPALLAEAGFSKRGVHVVQPAGIKGEVKQIAAITMENIIGSVLHAGLATKEETDSVLAELYRIAEDNHTFMSLPRIVQAWGYRP